MPDEDEIATTSPSHTRQRTATALQVAGGASVSGAAFGLNVLLGLLTAGVCMIVFGVATELGGS